MLNTLKKTLKTKAFVGALTASLMVAALPAQASMYENVSEAQFEMASEKHDQGDYLEAIKHYNYALETNPNHIPSLMKRGVAFQTLGLSMNAIEDYDRVIELSPAYTQAYMNRGYQHMKMGDYDEARADLSYAVKVAPNVSETHNLVGLYNLKVGADKEAVINFSRAIVLEPNNVDSYLNRAQAYMNQGQYHNARIDLLAAQVINPFDARTSSLLEDVDQYL